MKRLLSCLCVLSTASSVFAAAFTPGDLIVSRVGDGGAALSTAAAALFLDEYTPGGTLVQTIAMPTAVSGSQLALTIQGTATSEGFLQLSANGQYLTLAGYNAAPATATPSSSTAAAVNRTIGLVTIASGSVDTSTAINSGTAGAARSATTADGTRFWVSSASSGVGTVAFGAPAAATQLSTTPSNTRVTRDIGGQIYVSSASGAFQGVSTIGTGLPTASGQTTTLLPGFPTATGPSSYDFFVNGNNAWVADDRTSGVGGIQHWTLNAGTWTLSYTLAPSATTGVRGLFVDLSGANPTLFGTTTDNKVVGFVDTGAGSSANFLFADNTANTVFRGIVGLAPVTVPEPSTAALIGLGLMALSISRRRK
jgi:hypothetical protein